jgi:antitoxin component YwqK of YwqJK toxin-antitoxin module
MKTTRILLATLAFIICITRAEAQCQGDCNNGYGSLISGKTTTTGFFKNGKLEGLGDVYGEKLYSGQWKDGKKEGFVVYKDEEYITYGLFVNDLKQGVHITPFDDGSITIDMYDKGVMKTSTTTSKSTNAACPYGTCETGTGVKIEMLADKNMIVYTGNFVNGVLEGAGFVLYSGSPNRIYGTFKGGISHGVKVTMYPTGGIELAEMKDGKRHGRLINIFPDGKSEAHFFENDVPVKK